MQNQTSIIRQTMRCGHEPPLPVERDEHGVERYRGQTVEAWRGANVCAGYACELPEVAEVARCFLQWEKGTLADFLDGRPPGHMLLEALGALQVGIREHEVDVLSRPKAGG
jgi:hypothetical protein